MATETSLLDLNNVNRKLMTQLPGVSKDIAYRIINFRKRHGGFRNWSDVETATGFSPRKMEVLKTRATLGPRPAPVDHERQIISRWRGKPDDALHARIIRTERIENT
jgi:Helix-hairpin-helix motif